jgi:hypothetical protein
MGRSVDQTSQCSIVSISLIPTPKPQHPNNKSRSLFNINRITIFGFLSSQLQNPKNKSKSPQIRKRNITISKSWISLILAPTPKNKSRSPQIRKRNITIFKSWISLIPTPKKKQQIKKSS